MSNLLGLINTEFTVVSDTAAGGGSAGRTCRRSGSVFDALNLGNGYENIYTDIPGAAGANDTVTDTLVTPFGNVNLDSLFGNIDAAAPLQPGDAFTGLEAGDSSIGADAFTIDGVTLDPMTAATGGVEGFNPVAPITTSPPLLDIGGGALNGAPLVTQTFDVFSGTGSGATDIGTISTGENVTSLLGLTNTELTVESATAASGADASDLPTKGSGLRRVQPGQWATRTSTPTSRAPPADPTPSPTP